MLGETAKMSISGGVMYTQHHMSSGSPCPLRPPPPLIDTRKSVTNTSVPPMNGSILPGNCSVPPANCSVPRVNGMESPTNCSVPRLNCMVPSANCSVPPANRTIPPVNCQAAPITYRTAPVATPEDYVRRCCMHGYLTSPSYPQQLSASSAANTGPCCMGHASVYTNPKASNQGMQHNGVSTTGQPQKFSTRYAPYTKETPAQSSVSCSVPQLFSANRAACDVDTAAVKDADRYYSVMQGDTWAAKSESKKRLAEKIWRRRIETQSCLDELNVHRRMSSCVVTQQIIDEELVRCYSGSVERAATMQTHSDGRRMCPPFVSTSPPMTACAQVNAGQNTYSPLCVNITPSDPSTTHAQQNMGQNTYSVLRENISPPLHGACGNLWALSYGQENGETLPVINSGQSASGTLLPLTCAQRPCGTSPTSTCVRPTCGTSSTTTCAQPTRCTSRAVEFSNIETVEMIYFRKFPCNLFKKQPINPQDTNPSTVAHVEPLESSSPRDHLSANAAGEQLDHEHVDSPTYHTERHSLAMEQPCVSDSSAVEHNALDSSFGSIDSCDD
ncbi:hypothetical protein LSAT2_029014, partial [Lamellibrachia satsuma]